MLKAKHFANTELHHYYSAFGIYILKSEEAINHLDAERIDGVYNIGTLSQKPPGIIINYYHLDRIEPNTEGCPHHVGSYKTTHTGPSAWELICEHEIIIYYPEISLIRKLHQTGNGTVRQAMIEFIKKHKYFDVKSMPFDDATWLMANLLGKNE